MAEGSERATVHVMQALEEQIERLKAEAEAAEIHFEQTCQSLESRYAQLLQEHEATVADRETLKREAVQTKEQLELVGKKQVDAESLVLEKSRALDRQSVEIRELQNDKRSLLQLLDQRNDELAEAKANAKSYLDKILVVTEENSQARTKLRDAESEAANKERTLVRVQQEKENVERHSNWLNEELENKSATLLSERKQHAAEKMQLKSRIGELEASMQEMQMQNTRLKESLNFQESKGEEMLEKLRENAERLSSSEAHYEEELATSQRLAQLHKENAEESAARVNELEDILKSLEGELKQLSEQHRQEILRIKSECDEAKRQAEESEQKLQKSVREVAESPVFQTPQLPHVTLRAPGSEELPQSPGLSATPFQALTPSAAYSKYAQAAEAWRQERAERRRLQSYLDEIMAELEKKAPLIESQREEYERLLESHSQISARLESAASEKRHLEALLTQSRSSLQRETRARKLAETHAVDANKQLRRLLLENERLRGVHPEAEYSVDTEAESTVVDANSVISMELVEYGSVVQMQEQNRKLLAVARQLAADREVEEKERTKKIEEAISEQTKAIGQELEALKEQRERQMVLVEQIARQRDLYRSLLHEKGLGGGDSVAREDDQVQAGEGGTGRLSGHFSEPSAPGESAFNDLREEFEQYKKESAENQSMLRKEVDNLQEQLSANRSEAARHRAEAEFQRQRYEMLAENLKSQKAELDSVVAQLMSARNSSSQSEQRAAVLMAELNAALDSAKQESARANLLQSERDSLERLHNKDTERISSLTEEKYKLIAEAEGARQLCDLERDASNKAQQRMSEQLQQMQSDWTNAQRELALERTRARDSSSANAMQAQKLEELRDALQKELAEEKGRRMEAEKEAEIAGAKISVMQQQVQTAEETLSQVLRSREKAAHAAKESSPTEHMSGDVAELQAQVASLKDELAEAQEAAAAANAHAAQYKAIASAADESLEKTKEAMDDLQKSVDRLKQENDNAQSVLREKLQNTQQELADTRKKAAESIAEAQAAAEEAQQELEKLKVDVTTGKHSVANYEEQIRVLKADVEEHHKQWRSAQNSYERELLLHADDVKKLSAMEQEVEQSRSKIQKVQAEREDALTKAQESEQKRIQLDAEMRKALELLEERCNSLEKQNNLMHKQLEKFERASSHPEEQAGGEGSSGGPSLVELNEVVRFLRKEKETLSVQLSLAQQERARLVQRAEHARREAEDAKGQLASLKSELDVAGQKESWEAQRKALEEQANLLRESNMALRAESTQANAQLSQFRKDYEALQSELEPLKAVEAGCKAEMESKQAELDLKAKEATRWKQRAQQLLEKYGQVDHGEHQRVLEELSAAKQATEDTKAEHERAIKNLSEKHEQDVASLKKDNEKVRQMENLHARQISVVYNPQKKDLKAWKEEQDQMRDRLAELEKAVASEKSGSEQKAAAQKIEKEAREKARQEMEKEQTRLRSELSRYSDQLKKMSERLTAAHAAKSELADFKSRVGTLESEKGVLEQKLKDSELEVARAKSALLAAVRKSSQTGPVERKPKQPIPSVTGKQTAPASAPSEREAKDVKVEEAAAHEEVQDEETEHEEGEDGEMDGEGGEEEGEYPATADEEEAPDQEMEADAPAVNQDTGTEHPAHVEASQAPVPVDQEAKAAEAAGTKQVRKASEAGLNQEPGSSKRARGNLSPEAPPFVPESIERPTTDAPPPPSVGEDDEAAGAATTQTGNKEEQENAVEEEATSEEEQEEGEIDHEEEEDGESEEEEGAYPVDKDKGAESEVEPGHYASAEEGEFPSSAPQGKSEARSERGEQAEGKGKMEALASKAPSKPGGPAVGSTEKSEQGKHKSFERITFKPNPPKSKETKAAAGAATSGSVPTARGAARAALRGAGASGGVGRGSVPPDATTPSAHGSARGRGRGRRGRKGGPSSGSADPGKGNETN
uniref:Nucleoprotein TPR/MLP1 domain-containing protein n=1 Tax=Picocystis salinarum TaxID=88271 RepID=A0A7S3XDP3_9CHLO